ncbi:monovalent cation/H+ antiporter subunit E [Corynebacterium sp. zg-331]|uniref:monovalent cation/H+ antiporter subunit E n=1 Tax=unclassified Corynebacterium TaxID=2624378 RepID=UPI00128C2121|nr:MULTISPECIES: monovalent cation/H+ antiporter subunit E [unclassified Corynebacterium]MBC3186583.1 monovalent cation/H+ antiporter subunit E [Corynebacterium sp. zg-331]MPV53067.1 monovalent cation/H+ antiporter subunit E [Corynebacterium sp. zg331]
MNALTYIPWLIKEIVVSAVSLALSALRPRTGFDPVVVAYPLRVHGAWDIFWFSTSITVTPGTLSLGLRAPEDPDDPTILLVQAVHGSDPHEVVLGLADMEARLAPAVRGEELRLAEDYYRKVS